MSGWHLFEATGIEIEYMIVDRVTLAVRPLADRVLAAANGGEITSEVDRGLLSWSNELVSHVIELKTTAPATSIDPDLLAAFAGDVREIDRILAPLGAQLLPTAMHPLMDPSKETVLWPHDYSPVYQTYDRIFGCQGHGWSNLQSLHLNLPFRGDQEFGRLHAAIRLLLPILPALAASSPLADGKITGFADSRMEAYRTNSKMIASVAGEIVPEAVFDRQSYERTILEPMYRDIAADDPEGVLRDEFLNARGAIARFGRGSIEIRVLDVQECPSADLAIAAAAVAVLRLLVSGHFTDTAAQQAWPTAPLAALLFATTRDGAEHRITDREYLRTFGLDTASVTAGDLWRRLVEQAVAAGELAQPWAAILEQMLDLGPVAARLRRLLGPRPSREEIIEAYRRLAECLRHDELLRV